MQRVFFSGLFITLILNILIKPLALFGIDAVVQNRVGASEYGTYFSLLNLSILFNILLDIGINNYTTKIAAQDPKKAIDYFGKVVSLRILLFLFYSFLTLLIGYIIGYRSHEFIMLSILMVNQLLIMLTQFCRSYFSGFHLFKTDAIISILDKLLLIIICGFALYSSVFNEKFEIFWFVGIQSICYLITFFIAFILLLRKIKKQKYAFDFSFSLTLIKKSFPYAILILLMILYSRTDSVILERLHPDGKTETGIYAQGFRLLDALYMFGMIFVGLLYPMFSRQIKKGKQTVFPLLKTAGNLLMGGSILVVTILIFQSENVLNLIYEENIYKASISFKWLMLGFLGICLNFIFGTLLTANGNLRELSYISFFAIIINLVMNFLLIPSMGAKGAAISMFATQTFVSISQFLLAKAKFKFPINLRNMLPYFIYLPLLISPCLFIKNDEILFISQLAIGLISLFVLKFININELKKAFINKETI